MAGFSVPSSSSGSALFGSQPKKPTTTSQNNTGISATSVNSPAAIARLNADAQRLGGRSYGDAGAATVTSPSMGSFGGAGGASQLQALLGGGAGGGAGGSTGGGASSPASTYNPSTFSVTAQNNPQLEALQGQAAQLQQGLAAGSDQDATLALQRQRDLNSGAAKEFGADAASRGIFGSGAAAQDLDNRLVSRGQDQLGQLNASLAGDARNKQLQVLGAQSGLAGQQAQLTQADKQFALNTYEAQEGAKRAQAQLQLSAQQSQAQQGMQLASLLSQMYTGF